MSTISINSKSHTEMIDITYDIEKLIPENFGSGICHLFCMHTTAGLTINENADPDVVNDMIRFIGELIPWNDKQYRHMEGNTAAHLKSTFFGPTLTIHIENGKPLLGTWQSVYFCEFDGPRYNRKISVRFFCV
jgi:secondary thiamine-phosphate synthase enzyme